MIAMAYKMTDTATLPGDFFEELHREKAERSLLHFIQQAWPIVEPGTPFVGGRHLDAICEHLEAVTDGRIRKLVISMPPRHSKSLSVSVFWFCWSWIVNPSSRWIYASYSYQYATRDSRKCREIITSPWYQRFWGDKTKLKEDANTVVRFENASQGFRQVATIAGQATGEGGDFIVCDDANSADDRYSEAARAEVTRWWSTVMATRVNDPATTRRVLIGQRIHENDLIGHVLASDRGYVHLCLPARYEPDHPYNHPTSIGWRDWRQTEGELLWPERFNEEALADLTAELEDPYNVAGQLQQRPAPAKGAIFDKAMFRYYRQVLGDDGIAYLELLSESSELERRIDSRQCYWIQTADTALEESEGAAYTVILTAIVTPPPVKLLFHDVFRERLSVPKQYNAIIAQRSKYPQVKVTGVEYKASGIGLVQQAASDGYPFLKLPAEGSKEKRAAPLATFYENRMVYHRTADQAPWLETFENELLLAPAGQYWDQVDTAAYAALMTQKRAFAARQAKRSLVFSGQKRAEADEEKAGEPTVKRPATPLAARMRERFGHRRFDDG